MIILSNRKPPILLDRFKLRTVGLALLIASRFHFAVDEMLWMGVAYTDENNETDPEAIKYTLRITQL